jgi:hypothetical protein
VEKPWAAGPQVAGEMWAKSYAEVIHRFYLFCSHLLQGAPYRSNLDNKRKRLNLFMMQN